MTWKVGATFLLFCTVASPIVSVVDAFSVGASSSSSSTASTCSFVTGSSISCFHHPTIALHLCPDQASELERFANDVLKAMEALDESKKLEQNYYEVYSSSSASSVLNSDSSRRGRRTSAALSFRRGSDSDIMSSSSSLAASSINGDRHHHTGGPIAWCKRIINHKAITSNSKVDSMKNRFAIAMKAMKEQYEDKHNRMP